MSFLMVELFLYKLEHLSVKHIEHNQHYKMQIHSIQSDVKWRKATNPHIWETGQIINKYCYFF